jgi:iron complex transport system permease protein
VRRRRLVVAALGAAVVLAYALSLMVGQTFYGPDVVLRVLVGDAVPGASFAIGELRLPRASLGLLAGVCFGVAGVVFQTMLRNPLASPDILGISQGAAAAAVVGIVVLSLGDSLVSMIALIAALLTALALYLLSDRRGFAGTRLILIGIGIDALLRSITSYVLSQASEWDLAAAMQWLTGSLNGASWSTVWPVALACVIVVPLLLARSRDLGALSLGDDVAASLGVAVRPARLVLVVGAVALLAFATAACGPIAFVAFLAGPIAARIVGAGGSLLVPAALVGALIVLLGDLAGQNLFENRYPVGVVTGALGAPFLLYLLVRTNRAGGSL